MRILFDECAPWPLSKLLKGHTCSNPVKEGWRGIQNGELLKLAEAKFGLFLTCDQGIRYQQNLKGRKIASSAHLTRRLEGVFISVLVSYHD